MYVRKYKYTVKDLKTGRIETGTGVREVAEKFGVTSSELYRPKYEIIKEYEPDTSIHYKMTDKRRNLTVEGIRFDDCVKLLGYAGRKWIYDHIDDFEILCDGEPYVIKRRGQTERKHIEGVPDGKERRSFYKGWKITQFDFSLDVLTLSKRTNYRGYKSVEEMEKIKEEMQKIVNGFGLKNTLVFDISSTALRSSSYHYLIIELHIKLKKKSPSFKKTDFEETVKLSYPVVDRIQEFLDDNFVII